MWVYHVYDHNVTAVPHLVTRACLLFPLTFVLESK